MTNRKEKYKFADLFAGAGGFSLGFEMAGLELICCAERDDWAVQTLKKNHPEVKIVHDDVRNYSTDHEIVTACGQAPDVIIGGPPCQGFSNAGPVKDPKDPRNSLFKNFARWVEVLQPTAFVMENVKGLLNRKSESGEKVIQIIEQTFRDLGYEVEIWKLNAANYGVPQLRERIFVVGNLFNEKIGSPEITHNVIAAHKESLHLPNAITVSEAISDLPILYAGEGEEEMNYSFSPSNIYQEWARSCSQKVYNHVAMQHTQRLINRYRIIQNGVKLEELPDEYKVLKRNGNGSISSSEYHMNYRHLKPDSVSFTIPASFYSNFIHPSLPRNITAREAARIQSFPDWYCFKGKRTQVSSSLLKRYGRQEEDHLSQYNQIGNAVPPLLAKAIAEKILKFLYGKEGKKIDKVSNPIYMNI